MLFLTRVNNKWNDWIDDHYILATWLFVFAVLGSLSALVYTDRIYYFFWVGLIIYCLCKLFRIVIKILWGGRDVRNICIRRERKRNRTIERKD